VFCEAIKIFQKSLPVLRELCYSSPPVEKASIKTQSNAGAGRVDRSEKVVKESLKNFLRDAKKDVDANCLLPHNLASLLLTNKTICQRRKRRKSCDSRAKFFKN
jgi:hypothetical protein